MKSIVIFSVAILSLVLITAPVLALAQSSKNTVPEFTRSLLLGSRGDDVRSLQEFLARDKEIYPEGLATGYYGPKTAEAVKRWQKKNKLEAVGIVGPKTIAKFKEIGRAAIKEPIPSTAATPEVIISPTPADTTPPIATLTLRAAAPTKIYIRINPNEEVTAVYEYGLTANYGITQEVSNQYFSSSTAIYIENLTPSTTYQIRAKVTDRAGNIGYSSNYTFTTPSLSQAPIISVGPEIISSTATPAVAVTINWETNIACVGTAYFDVTTAFGNAKSDNTAATDHSVSITGLAPGAAYIYKVTCATTDKTVESDNIIFTATSSSPSSSAVFNSSLASIWNVLKDIIDKIKIW